MRKIQLLGFVMFALTTSLGHTMEVQLAMIPADFTGTYRFVPGSCSKVSHENGEERTVERSEYAYCYLGLPEIRNDQHGIRSSDAKFEEEDTLQITQNDEGLFVSIIHKNTTKLLEYKKMGSPLSSHVNLYRKSNSFAVHMSGNCRVKMALTKLQNDSEQIEGETGQIEEIELKYYYKFSGMFGCSKHQEYTTTCKLQKITEAQ